MEAVLLIEIMEEPQSNLEEEDNVKILKDDFSSITDQFVFTSIAAAFLDWQNETS